jgi:hypothetical protein
MIRLRLSSETEIEAVWRIAAEKKQIALAVRGVRAETGMIESRLGAPEARALYQALRRWPLVFPPFRGPAQGSGWTSIQSTPQGQHF